MQFDHQSKGAPQTKEKSSDESRSAETKSNEDDDDEEEDVFCDTESDFKPILNESQAEELFQILEQIEAEKSGGSSEDGSVKDGGIISER